MNAIVLLLAVAILLCFAFNWDTNTHHMINKVIVETYTDEPSPEPFIYTKYRLHDYDGCSLAEVNDMDYDETAPIRVKRDKFYRSHCGKGATLHTYRVKGFNNKVFHPCC